MNENNQQQIYNDINNKSNIFLRCYRDYYNGRINDEVLAERTTQPFWHSLRLSKKRLQSKGISVDVNVVPEKKGNFWKRRFRMWKDGYHFLGRNDADVVTYRRYYKNGKLIGKMKDRERCSISLLKGDVQGDEGVCPNCGYHGKLSSFVDGCDACGTKFTVNDFEAKVSGFSLEENTSAKINRTVWRTAGFLGIVIGIFLIVALAAFILCVMRVMHGKTEIDAVSSVLGMIFSILAIPVTIKTIVILLIIYGVLSLVLVSKYRKAVIKEEIIKRVLPEYSVEDFCQNLEYELRNIHLTDKVETVSAFARCRLDEVVAKYRDVIECDMTRVEFLNLRTDADGYRVDVKATLRLNESKRKKVVTKYEKVFLTLFGKSETIKRPVTALRMYQCSGCGASFDVLEGEKCEYCGCNFDYSKYGWIIEKYQGKQQRINLHHLLKSVIVTIFILVFGAQILHPVNFEEGNLFEVYQTGKECVEWMAESMGSVARIDELCEGVELVQFLDQVSDYSYVYEVKNDNGREIVQQYIGYLESEGFACYQEAEGVYLMYSVYQEESEFTEENSYHQIIIKLRGQYISVEQTAVEEELEKNWEEVLDVLEEEARKRGPMKKKEEGTIGEVGSGNGE